MPAARSGYRTTARIFHWGMAVAVLLMIPAGLIMIQDGLPKAVQDTLFVFHKNLGVLLIPVIIARLAYRLRHHPPPLPDTMPHWQARAAGVTHGALYLLLLVMPISGFVRVRAGGFPVELLDLIGAGPWLAKSEPLAEAAGLVHAVAAVLLIGLLMLHVAAALHHALWRRDTVWSRIWPPVPRS